MNNFSNENENTGESPGIAPMSKADKMLPAYEQLTMAQKLFAAGEFPLALQYAQLALEHQEHKCAAHALLGDIYNAAGEKAKAQMHFQAALTINDQPAEIITNNPLTTQQHRTLPGILMLVLISCILLSGIAALFSLHPARHQLNEGDIFQIDNAKTYQIDSPRWTWQVPTPVAEPIENDAAPAAPPVPVRVPVSYNTPAPAPVPATPSGVLGPAAHTHLPASSNKISLKAAQDAYDNAEYQRALTIFELLHSRSEVVSPHLEQNIAYCHQQLGNSAQAQINLRRALEGYRLLLLEDADNTEAQQGIIACENAIKQLHYTREP